MNRQKQNEGNLQPTQREPKDSLKENPTALIAAIRDGDSQAFGDFYMGYADSIVRFLTKIIGNKEDAREITQDTFALIWENRENLNPHTTLKGFVAGTARNLAFQSLRARIKSREADLDASGARSEYAGYADEEIISLETEILLRHVINNMPPQRRRVFELSRDEGLTYNEIAQRLNISYNSVRTHIDLAKEDIRNALALAIIFLLVG